eukprot:15014043-Heterocapsa_arctica.AAC.1
MTTNPVFNKCYETRCFEWFHTTKPTDEHLVLDNAVPNEKAWVILTCQVHDPGYCAGPGYGTGGYAQGHDA